METQIVILGGGTGGTLVANRLRKQLPPSVAVTVVDQNNEHLYQPGLLFVPFGLSKPESLTRRRDRQLHRGINYVESSIDRVDVAANQVLLANGAVLPYDVLVIATGADLLPGETPGMLGAHWNEKVCTFYSLEGATALEARLTRFDHGRLVVNCVDMPIKCPVAPLEFCFLADWYFQKRGVRDRVEITFVTPLDGAFTTPVASAHLGRMLEQRDIHQVTEFNTGEIEGESGELIAYDDRRVGFDLAVVVPLHGGASYVGRSEGLGDELGFIPADQRTLQSSVRPNIFVIGDAAALPASKAGSVAHYEGDAVCTNIGHLLAGDAPEQLYDGHTNCFIETGFDKALLIDFNYDTEPLAGHFPSAVGLPLLKESHLNHIGKLLFEWFYWHALLPGREIPGINAPMPRSGKDFSEQAVKPGQGRLS